MNRYFGDFHIHVGFSESGHWVKIPTSRRLTVRTILDTALRQKGLQIIGIVDALSPWVQEDIQRLITEGSLVSQTDGGYLYHNGVTLLLGAEIETCETGGGMCHSLAYLPDLQTMQRFSREMSCHIRNIGLSSQNAHMSLERLVEIAGSYEALFIPAHVFTPHKSLYGACAKRLSALLPESKMELVTAIELGLSADTEMADRIQELWGFQFLTNSDAHSPEKIGREYNLLEMEKSSHSECALAFRRKAGRGIVGNYGMDPRLGKYHRSCCEKCGTIFDGDAASVSKCPGCGGKRITTGVAERIEKIADFPAGTHPAGRPEYHYHVPLQMAPGLGGKTIEKLLAEFGTEMKLLHEVSVEEIRRVAGKRSADTISAIRNGASFIQSGGGGIYGRVVLD
jgi:uncharacterized protein (TIGR00375 family)